MLLEDRLVLFMIHIYGKIGYNQTVNSYFLATLTKALHAILHHGVKISHNNEWDMNFVAYAL